MYITVNKNNNTFVNLYYYNITIYVYVKKIIFNIKIINEKKKIRKYKHIKKDNKRDKYVLHTYSLYCCIILKVHQKKNDK
ncbi:hypothetical protein PFBG_01727 [Plasmodium falciparum 7G8]|uniref:Uncharacterized protein n=1 Tax=Plasmodium falciparum (isolate 7G8) TaxID=57266 RepID=W7F4E8_PLAF8|nr:hypothetical protein PFBG_01727 [Plasmodium falciparum 7G8]